MHWRARLADGRTVDYDGQNTPQPFLDLILRFDLIRDGAIVLSVAPTAGKRLIYRRRTHLTYGGSAMTLHIAGLLDKDTGSVILAYVNEDGVVSLGGELDVELTPAEVA